MKTYIVDSIYVTDKKYIKRGKNMNSRLDAQVIKENEVYQFKISGYIKSYKIYYSNNRALTHKAFITEGNTTELTIKRPEEHKRLFFYIEDEGGQSIVCATRLLEVESIDNFRDIGGYKTKDGKSVKWGYFYRCANLGKMTKKDEKYLEDVQIRTIFDFRSLVEVEQEKDIIPNGCQYMNHSGIITMDEQVKKQGNFDVKMLIMDLIKTPEKIDELSNFLMEGYQTMAVSSGAFSKLFEAIKNEVNVPLLFHCTAGKDRTGIGAAYILLALGVDEETVIEDYCLSNVYRAAANKKQIDTVAEFVKDVKMLEFMKGMLEVKEAYIRVTLDTIYENYGTFETFLEEQLNVSQEELEQLRAKYLY